MKDKRLKCKMYKNTDLSIWHNEKHVSFVVGKSYDKGSTSLYAYLDKKQVKEVRDWLTKYLRKKAK